MRDIDLEKLEKGLDNAKVEPCCADVMAEQIQTHFAFTFHTMDTKKLLQVLVIHADGHLEITSLSIKLETKRPKDVEKAERNN